MSFLFRAQKAHERGDVVTAVITLIEGLKRNPDDEEALDLLLRYYGLELPNPGLEHDLLKVVEPRPDADDILSVLVDNLDARGKIRMADALLEGGEARGLRYVPAEDEEPAPEEAEDEEERPAKVSPQVSAPVSDVPVAGPAVGLPTQTHEENSAVDVAAPVDSALESETAGVAESSSTEEGGASAERGVSTRPLQRRPERGESERVRSRRSFLPFAAVVVAAGLVIAGIFTWDHARKAAAVAEIDGAISELDPSALEPLEAEVKSAKETWPSAEEIAVRDAFVRELKALNFDEETEALPIPAERSRWGMAARVARSLRNDDIEAAIEWSTRASRTYPGSLAASWAEGRVEEERGRFTRAAEIYTALREREPSFVPSHLGLIRLATYEMSRPRRDAALQSLEEVAADHPYLALRNLQVDPLGVLLGPGPTAELEPVSPERPDTFLRGITDIHQALRHANRRETDDAVRRARAAAEALPYHVAAQLTLGVVSLLDLDVARAVAAFREAAEGEDLPPHVVMATQAVATGALSRAGRPDLALKFATPFRQGPETLEPELPTSLRLAAADQVGGERRTSLLARRSLAARVEALVELGRTQDAVEMVEALAARDIHLVVVGRLLNVGFGVDVPDGLASPAEGEEAILSAARAYLNGTDFEADGDVPEEVRSDGRLVRYQAATAVAARDTARAMQLLRTRRPPLVDAIGLDGIRLRAYARLGRENVRFVELYEGLQSMKPVGMTRLADLAASALWQGNTDAAQSLVTSVLEKAPDHREANWLRGLLLRARGDEDAAEKHFRRSGRSMKGNAPLLVELGWVSLRMDRNDEARSLFYKAILKDRSNLDALRGFGTAIVASPGRTGKRDLERVLSTYSAKRKWDVERGELMKWRAVLAGVRGGREEGMTWLRQAREMVGERADILLEWGRFYEAAGDHGEARAHFARALRKNSTLAAAHLGLARVALEDGDRGIARDHLQKYLELAPRAEKSEWARQKLEAL